MHVLVYFPPQRGMLTVYGSNVKIETAAHSTEPNTNETNDVGEQQGKIDGNMNAKTADDGVAATNDGTFESRAIERRRRMSEIEIESVCGTKQKHNKAKQCAFRAFVGYEKSKKKKNKRKKGKKNIPTEHATLTHTHTHTLDDKNIANDTLSLLSLQ